MGAWSFFVLLGLMVLAGGCSFDRAAPGKLQIIIDDKSSTQAQLVQAFGMSSPYATPFGSISTQSLPTGTSDFTCYAVNVTGVGIVPNSKINDCIFNDNMAGRGVGIISDPLPKALPHEMDVPSGPSRVIQIYGLYPPSQECTGVQNIGSQLINVWMMGEKTVDLTEATTVTVPVSYPGGNPSLTCKGGGYYNPSPYVFPYAASKTWSAGMINIYHPSVASGQNEIVVGGVVMSGCTYYSTPARLQCGFSGSSYTGVMDTPVDVVVRTSGTTNFVLPLSFIYTSGAYLDFGGPPQYDFGSQSAAASATIYVYNVGAANTVLGTASISGSAKFSITGGTCSSGANLSTAPGANNCTYNVQFNSVGTGSTAFSAYLDIPYSGSTIGAGSARFGFVGTGL